MMQVWWVDCRVGIDRQKEERADGCGRAFRIYHGVAPCTSLSPRPVRMPFLSEGDLQKRNLLS